MGVCLQLATGLAPSVTSSNSWAIKSVHIEDMKSHGFALIIEMRSQTRTPRDVRLVTAHSVVEAVEFRLNTALPHQQPLSSTTLAAYDKGVSGMVHGTAGLHITSASYEVRA